MLPREKLIKYGVEKLTNDELLAVILRSGIKGKNVFELSKELLKKYKTLTKLEQASFEELSSIKGIGKVKSINLKASLEFGKRYHLYKMKEKKVSINSPEDVYRVSENMIYYDREVVKVISLDSKLNIINSNEVSQGTANASIAHPRDIFKCAIKNNAISIVLVHNHPSGNPEPSKKDFDLTNKINEAGTLLGIKLNDHVIIGNNSYYSFNLQKKVYINERE
ncbi:UPF0758 protein [Tepiditoga spiralis]|uniref:UPF0758 protein n=1 Tax=Tepiditoga spiralis TaxID=2108365 RepID=A0A7G1G992_9BACT|nr:DNA repair protein RadC [Tepiditoga spiralis]BBE32046.1 UPF0758 protein [Tepiditoga spiralis]